MDDSTFRAGLYIQRTEELKRAAAIHNIVIDNVAENSTGNWFIRCYQELNVDGCRNYATYIHDDLEEMVSILIKHFRFSEEVNLMNIFSTNLFKYLAGEMFLDGDGNPRTIALTITNVKMQEIANGRGGNDKKPVVSFKERDKLLVLNKTNARAIAQQYGGETNDWVGRQIAITAEHGSWFGNKGVRVVVLDHIPANAIGINGNGKKNGKTKQEPATKPEDIDFEDAPLFDDEPELAGAYAE